jgi:hypothetical protein
VLTLSEKGRSLGGDGQTGSVFVLAIPDFWARSVH